MSLADKWSAARIRRRRSKQPEHPTLTLEAQERDRSLKQTIRRSEHRTGESGLAAAKKRQAAEKIKGR